jgi:hypothetical protein
MGRGKFFGDEMDARNMRTIIFLRYETRREAPADALSNRPSFIE